MTKTANVFLAYLAQSLSEGGSETEMYLDRITTLTGETITTADFTFFGRGVVTAEPTTADKVEFCSFTGVDATDVKLTGLSRGLSAKGNSVIAANKKYHAVGTKVIISFGVHNIEDIIDYINDVVSGAVGTASDANSGTTKITEDLSSLPRAMSALVSQQATPNMTLKVNPFAIATLDKNVSFAGGNTGTITAPVSNPRIDLVVYSTDSSAVAVRAGSEGISPSEPTPSNGDIVLCSVYHRIGETTILERDTSPNTQGYIKRWYTPNIYTTSVVPTGTIQDFAMSTLPSGWLDCDGSAVSRTTYAALFTAISITWGVGDGSTTFNLPDLRGRSRVSSGTGTKVATFASRSSNVITVTGLSNASNNEFQTGKAVLYSAPSGAMSGLTHNTTYYLVRTGNLTFSLATSLANAQNGTVISLSSDGSGVQTFTQTLTARTLGDTGGEENHAMSSSELLAHTHSNAFAGGNGYLNSPAGSYAQGTSGSTGGNAAMNIMQPFGVIKTGIKS